MEASNPKPVTEAQARQFIELDRMARLLDSQWRIPGTELRFGVDAVAGLVPGVGDLATGAVSAYLIANAARLGIPKSTLAKMIGNVVLDTAVGAIPVVGSVFDLFFKANNRNIALIQQHVFSKLR